MSFFQSSHTMQSGADALRSANLPFVGVQTKLNIGKSNDKYEKEADAVADKVVNRKGVFGNQPFIAAATTVQRSGENDQEVQNSEESIDIQEKPIHEGISSLGTVSNAAQLKCDECERKEKEGSIVQEKCEKCEEQAIQSKAENGISQGSRSKEVGQQLEQRKGKGNKMSGDTLSEMNQSFGTDLSDVSIHTDSQAIQMARDLNAQAFTHGNDIYFGQGKYNPKSREGKHLLAHELTHTIQQGKSKEIQRKEYNSKAKCLAASRDSIGVGKDAVAKDAMQLTISNSVNGDPCACLIVIHNDERNAMLTAKLLHKYCSYNLVLLNDNSWKNREIILPNQGCTKHKGKYTPVSQDPNSLFPKDIAQKYLFDKGNKRIGKDMKKLENSKDKKEIAAYTQMQFFKTMKVATQNFSLPVIALHNNDVSDTVNYMSKIADSPSPSPIEGLREMGVDKTKADQGKAELEALKSKLKAGFGNEALQQMDKRGKTNIYRWCIANDLVKCHVGLPEDPDKVNWTTNESDFEKMKSNKINVVLESSTLKEGKSESAGDLSTLFVILEKTIDAKIQDEVKEGGDMITEDAKRIWKLLQEINALIESLDKDEWSDALRQVLIKSIAMIQKSVELVVKGLGIGIQFLERKSDISKLRYMNIETPVDGINVQTDAGRIGSYEYIVESLKSVGLFCCGKDEKAITESDKKIKEGLKVSGNKSS